MTQRAIVALCSVTLVQAYLLVNVLPYSAYLVIHLCKNVTVEEAGPYAASLATSFMLGRTISAQFWGNLADVYGRRLVLILSLIGSGLASLWFGFASTYRSCLLARGMLGAVNSTVGVTKTLATELARKLSDDAEQLDASRSANTSSANSRSQDAVETRVVGLVVSMRAWGFLIAPACAGFLSDPLKTREDLLINAQVDTRTLVMYPYLLPNLFGFILCFSSAIAVYCEIAETLPNPKPFGGCIVPRILWGGIRESSIASASNKTYQSIETHSEATTQQPPTVASIWSRRDTRRNLIAYWMFSAIQIIIDEAFPLYCVATKNGLGGLSENQIGRILSLSGFIFALLQFRAYTWMTNKFGLFGSLRLGCLVGIVPVSLTPAASLFEAESGVNCYSIVYLSVLMGIIKVFQSAFFSSITVMANRTVPVDMRSTMNGIGGSGAGMSKAVAPVLVGLWMSRWLSADPAGATFLNLPVGPWIAYAGIGALGLPMLHYVKSCELNSAHGINLLVET